MINGNVTLYKDVEFVRTDCIGHAAPLAINLGGLKCCAPVLATCLIMTELC